MRIAFFIRALDGGGAQRDTILLANELARQGHTILLFTLVREGALSALVDGGVAVISVGGRHLRSAIRGLRRALIERRPDVLISSEAAPNLVAALASRLVPRELRPKVVWREVGSASISMRLDPYIQNRIAYRLLRYTARWADVIVALTDGASKDLADHFGIPKSRLARMTSNAVLDEAGTNAARSRRDMRQPNLIVSIGRLSPEKDHATLIRAFSKLARNKPLRLQIVGGGKLRGQLNDLIDELGLSDRVQLLGPLPDPFSVFRCAALAVSSSRYEGFGNAIVEALACGTPVVATDCPYGPREILADGRYGMLVPPGDADSMARAIERAVAASPDRIALRERAMTHTVARAAAALLVIVAGLKKRGSVGHRAEFAGADLYAARRLPSPLQH
jgi:glycosyltransferase involved in cell wall biosynthesis